MNTKTISTLIQDLNAKAQAAGEDIKASYVLIDQTWGDACGIAIEGTGDKDRAARFAQAYFDKHLSPKGSYNTQYGFQDLGEKGTFVNMPHGSRPSLEIADRYRDVQATGSARVCKLVYYPCAD